MQICHPNGSSAPTDVQPIPSALGNVSNPTIGHMVAAGWLRYAPTATPNVRASHWQVAGDAYEEVVDAVWTDEELAAWQTHNAAISEAQREEEATIVAAHDAAVAAIREQYRGITRTICQLAGVAVVDKFATVGGVADVVMAYGMGDNALQLTQYALFLKATLDELRRMDGDDAWERI